MPSHARSSKRRSKTHAPRFIVLAFVAAIFLAGALACLGGFKLIDSWLQDLPDYQDADAYLSAEPTKILDAEGNLIAEMYLQNRETITIDQTSPYVLKGTVDTEDERFYSHKGVDPQGIARAAIGQITRSSAEGGSTITQQLVRNTVLSDEQFERTIRRKVREAYIALELEKMFSKDEILMMYLNTIYYGQGSYGIEAASKTFFGKPSKDLTLAEAALLCALPQSPSKLDPTQNPEGAVERRNLVLRRMLSNGDITQEDYDQASAEELQLNYTKPSKSGALAYPYFVDYVVSQLKKDFSSETILKGGLVVKTTIQPTLQKYAEDACNTVIANGRNDKLDAALVSVDPHTGYIVAMVGGKDYNSDQFNLATQARRQPGSSFKTFTLAASIEEGMNPTTVFSGASPLKIDDWTVRNYGNVSYGAISVESATWVSSNTVFAQIIDKIGTGKVVDIAKRMGITSDLQQVKSITLGSEGVSPLEMASAYGTLATGGVHRDPVCITEINNRKGDVIFKHEDNPQKVLEPGVASEVTRVLEGVIAHGTASRAGVSGQPTAGKTGTSQRTRDLWFVGYTPQLATAVWTGYRQEDTIYYRGREALTNHIPQPIFKLFMDNALSGVERGKFERVPWDKYKNNSEWKTGYNAESEEIEEGLDEGEAPSNQQNENQENSQNNQPAAPGPGSSVQEIASYWQSQGMTVRIEQVYHDSIPAGGIISTSQGSTTVTIRVSKGKKPGSEPAPDPGGEGGED